MFLLLALALSVAVGSSPFPDPQLANETILLALSGKSRCTCFLCK